MIVDAVFFDLDGTLADTAPDLGGALNQLRIESGLLPLPVDELRPYASSGARGLLNAGFGLTPDQPEYPEMQQCFLDVYAMRLCAETVLFPGIDDLLTELDQRGIRWGIVTNKVGRFTQPLLKCLGLDERAACVISGDSAAKPKPDAAPLRMACAIARVQPGRSIYLGDDERDVQAGRAAGLRTAIALWGYLPGVPVSEWGADFVIDRPAEILRLLSGA